MSVLQLLAIGLLVLLELVGCSESPSCRPGFVNKSVISKDSADSSTCVCASEVPGLRDYVICDGESYTSQLLNCHCIANETNGVFIGPCAYGCFLSSRSLYYQLNGTYEDINKFVCGGKLNRRGRFCAKCAENHCFPVYSYSLKCVECHNSHHRYNWLLYITVAYLPLTVFLFIVIFFRVGVTSPPMEILVLVCQTMGSPLQMRPLSLAFEENLHSHYNINRGLYNVFKLCATIFGIWNLDFFRALYQPFCLSKNATMLTLFSLEYGIALYPLVLIVVMYTCVQLHSRGYVIIHHIWRPFHFCLARFRRQLDIQESLIESFATFLVLSYVKFGAVSGDILIPITLHNITLVTGSSDLQTVFYQPDTTTFQGTHLALAIVAIFAMGVFYIFPVFLFCLYPCFQKHVNTRRFAGHLLHTFMEKFQGHYKDGTNGRRDCRSFSAVYIILRLFLLLAYSGTLSINYYPIAIGLVMLTAVAVIVVQPYKYRPYNAIHTVLLMVLALWYLCLYSMNDAQIHQLFEMALFFLVLCSGIVYVYMISLVVHRLFYRDTCFRRLRKDCCRATEEGARDRPQQTDQSRANEHTPLLEVSERDTATQ